MATAKLYAPVLVLLFWTVVFSAASGVLVTMVAAFTLLGSMKIEIDEARRRYRRRHRR